MRWPGDWSEWILALGIGLVLVAGVLIFLAQVSQGWIGSLLIVVGLLLIAIYLLARARRLRELTGRFNLPTTLTLVQAILAVAFAIAEAALWLESSAGQTSQQYDIVKWTARIVAALFIGMVAIGLLFDRSERGRV